MASSTKSPDVSSSLSKLSLDTAKKTTTTKPKPKKPVVADSWEDEDLDSDSNSGSASGDATPRGGDDAVEGSHAPPPTPISPTRQPSNSQQWATSSDFSSASTSPPSMPPDAYGPAGERRRPEKTDAVARRMIASALGVKAPRMTEEQRAYDRSVRDQERKRREQEKAAEAKKKEEVEKAKAAIWDD